MYFNIVKRGFSTSKVQHVIKNVTVIGGGLMGNGIAQVAAQAGNNVILVDIDEKALNKAFEVIKTNTGRVAKRRFKGDQNQMKPFVEQTLGRIKSSTDVESAVKDADLVVEAIVENTKIKQKLFKNLDCAAPEKAIFATNTSSLSVTEIASLTKRKHRFGGMHFFNPVPVMELIEVVKTEDTSEETFKELWNWGTSLGKTCIKCKDTPGFVVNRLLLPYLNEAIHMVERGDASVEDIDIAMKLGAGYPMGPFQLADYSGHDTALAVLEDWHRRFPDNPTFKPTDTMIRMCEEGKFGVKSGEGFYKYN
ncbi:hydroxyacyl-coenzyme A dehydrogenase, mitochondrial-like [Coccinella septempunctata]|uniref:hydroxyacyl-coenzyme A dehydrogenase, mitochondrial-like n=1 Tax=Coccinella septempunctata TaxID=41139 RepID=UPI001D089991|nr:hydroxyacyl-coenzyme A dehydrogenase, mitochondrial-like [Coccinella septempunctata]